MERTAAEVAIFKVKCLRCGHEWFPRKQSAPVYCPKCKSPYWNKPREGT